MKPQPSKDADTSSMTPNFERATRAEVDLSALRSNVQTMISLAKPREVWVVVKANAYGHGAVPCAQVAIAAGAHGLCVALTQEALELRMAGITAPIMVLSEQPRADVAALVQHDIVCVAYNTAYIEALASEAARRSTRTRVHLKIDTGMHRVGVAPSDALERATHIVNHPSLILHGLMTHLAVADDPHHAATARQTALFDDVVAQVRLIAPELQHVHVANSAASLRDIAPGCTMARVGIAVYGLQPGSGVADHMRLLVPVMSLRTRVMHVQRVAAGEGLSYGLRSELEKDSTIATLPIGYADGIPRRTWQTDARILVGGKPRRIVGVVTMDQLMVDCENDPVSIGDEAVLFGRQGPTTMCVEDWADALGTITYEVVCAISPRVPRDYRGG